MCKNLEHKTFVDIIYIDCENAFDKVNIGRLLDKLIYIKCFDYIVNWLYYFVVGRTKRVCVRNTLSDCLPVRSGVPRGCAISPLLFIIYVNDIFNLPLSSKLKLFADDSKLYNLSENSQILQNDLYQLHEWFKNNFLTINITKTFVVRFGGCNGSADYGIGGVALRHVDDVKD